MFLPLDAWNCYMLAHACVYLYQSQADTVKTAKLRIAKLTPGTIFLMPKILAKSTMGSPLARLVESRIFKEYSLYLSTGRRQGIEYRYSKRL